MHCKFCARGINSTLLQVLSVQDFANRYKYVKNNVEFSYLSGSK